MNEKIKTDKLPCENCITLPICSNTKNDHSPVAFVVYLMDKCSILKNYIRTAPRGERLNCAIKINHFHKGTRDENSM
jgi:hypothetical protein